MRFRLVPNSVTLDDLERRNSPNRGVILPNSIAFGADYVKVVEDIPILSAVERPKNIVFIGITYHLWRYWQRITPSESDKATHSLSLADI